VPERKTELWRVRLLLLNLTFSIDQATEWDRVP
jgi:hypothetical protein